MILSQEQYIKPQVNNMIKLNDSSIKYYLLFGCDISNQFYDVGGLLPDNEKSLRSDTIILLIVNIKTHKVKIVSILRDICVNDNNYGKCKLNSLIVYYGPKKATKKIGNLFGIHINKYIVLNMVNMVKIIDLIGGIDIYLTRPEVDYINGMGFDSASLTRHKDGYETLDSEGLNHLNGIKTLTHVRNRAVGFCWERAKRQRNVIVAVVSKITNTIKPENYFSFGRSLLSYVKTNLNIFDIISLAKIAKKIKINEIETFSIPLQNTNSIKNDGVWRFEINFEDANVLLCKIVNEEDTSELVV